jgi:hypothetical protein
MIERAEVDRLSRRERERWAIRALGLGLLSVPAAVLLGWFGLLGALAAFGAFTWIGWLALRERSEGVPALAPGLRNAARIACDEAMLGWMQARTAVPDDDEIERVTRELETGLDRARDPLREPDPLERRPPPLAQYELAPLVVRGERFAELRAESGWAPASDEPGWERWISRSGNRELRAAVLRHPGAPRPWLICLHGYRMGQARLNLRLFDPLRLHHSLGLNLLVPVLPLHGARSIGTRSGDFFLDGRLVETRHALCQSVWELRRMVAWTRAEGAPAVGVYGISLGALCAALLASVEPDLDQLLLGMPLCDVADVLFRHAPPDRIARMNSQGLTRERVEEWLRPVTPLARTPKLAPDRVTIFAGTGDRIVPPGQALALHERWGRPRLEWLDAGHLTFFGDPRFRPIEAEALSRLHA